MVYSKVSLLCKVNSHKCDYYKDFSSLKRDNCIYRVFYAFLESSIISKYYFKFFFLLQLMRLIIFYNLFFFFSKSFVPLSTNNWCPRCPNGIVCVTLSTTYSWCDVVDICVFRRRHVLGMCWFVSERNRLGYNQVTRRVS